LGARTWRSTRRHRKGRTARCCYLRRKTCILTPARTSCWSSSRHRTRTPRPRVPRPPISARN